MSTIHVVALIAATLAVTALALRLALRVVLRLPADYLEGGKPPPLFELHGALGKASRPLQRVLGLALLAVGILLSLPGVPGPGVALIVCGLILAEIPGTHRLTRRVLRRKRLRDSVNRLRARFGEPPLSER